MSRQLLVALCFIMGAVLCGGGAARADVPLGSSVTISGEGSATYSTDPAARINAPENALVPLSAYLFASWTATPRFTLYLSGHAQSGSDAEFLGAFGRWNITGKGDVTLDVGRIPVPFGTFGSRVTPFRNPLIDYPLMYGYPVSLRADSLPRNRADLFLNGSGSGYFPHVFGDSAPATGVPMIAPYPYDLGGSLKLDLGHFSLKGALIGGSISESQNNFSRIGRTVVGRAEWNPEPAWRVGVSYARGPYLEAEAAEELLPGQSLLSQYQTTTGADVTYSAGAWQVVGEWARSKWDVATLQQALGASSWYLEGRCKLQPGLFVSARYSRMVFDTIDTNLPTLAARLPWDGNVSKLELGAGFYASKDVLLKGEVESQHVDRGGPHTHVESFSFSVNGRF